MKKMSLKNIWVAVMLFFLVFSSNPAKAAIGWYSDFVTVSIDAGALQYYWIGSNPNFGTQFNGANFGNVTSLTFGADMKYWADGTDTRTGGALYVQVNSGPATEYIWNHSSLGGNDYQGLLAGSTVNVISGLAEGAHTVTVWAKTWGAGGDSWLSNNGSNYTASFNLIPEPSSSLLMGLGLAGLAALRRTRKNA